MTEKELLGKLCRLIRYDILTSTSAAGSGHPTSSLSAVELMTVLFFGGFLNFDISNPKNLANDRVIFSKGHASPLLYSLYHAAGSLTSKELLTLRKFGSVLEGHPTPKFEFVDVATGSLGQGLSVGVGMAIGIQMLFSDRLSVIGKGQNQKTEKLNTDHRLPKVFVLMGDSEIDEGQIWEAIESASRYKLNNLIGILDVNKLGQYGETDEGWHLERYRKKFEAFGWNTILVKNGHDLEQVYQAYKSVIGNQLSVVGQNEKTDELTIENRRPTIIIVKTVKGKGVSFLENKDGWHGRTLNNEQLKSALDELGKVDSTLRGKIKNPEYQISNINYQNENSNFKAILDKLEKYNSEDSKISKEIATREAYGDKLVEIGRRNQKIVVLDAGVANSTFENKFQKEFPDRFFEISIAEENMLGVALGLSKFGFIPFLSTFAAFLTQTFDQVRMAQYSDANLKIIGSHAGVSIGQDGPSQMGLEDLAMMRSILNSIVFYPSDGVSTKKLIKIMEANKGIFYLRATRGSTRILYHEDEEFKIGGLKLHKTEINSTKKVLIISAGITVHEALKAQAKLLQENIEALVVDCYSIKPLDNETLSKYISDYKNIIVVEDHYPYGGLGEAIPNLIANEGLRIANFAHLCVRKLPTSGKPEELLRFEEIDAEAMVKKVKEIVKV